VRRAIEGQAGVGYEAVKGVEPVLKPLESVAHEGLEPVPGDDDEVGQAASDVCPAQESPRITLPGYGKDQ
jgi:hypothetical protein